MLLPWRRFSDGFGTSIEGSLTYCSLCRFYTRVLGMKRLARPPFPFSGAWLEGGGMILHLIDDDPTIPRKKDARDWKVLPVLH